MPRPKGSAELLEAHRRQALRLLEEAYSVNEVGRLVLAASSVMRWRDALQTGGEGALKVRCSRPPRLRATQRKRLAKLLTQGGHGQRFPYRAVDNGARGAVHPQTFPRAFPSRSRGPRAARIGL